MEQELEEGASPLNPEVLHERLQRLRKASALPWWRCTYAEFLLERSQEYRRLGRDRECQALCERLARWLGQREGDRVAADALVGERVSTRELNDTERQMVRTTALRLLENLDERAHLVPGPERDALKRRLQKALRLLDGDAGLEAEREVRNARLQLIRRLQRSYRARAQSLQHQSDAPQRTERRLRQGPVGPYNNRYCLEDVLQLVGERDPIWVEDFLETYDNLMQYGLKLGDLAQPARRPGR